MKINKVLKLALSGNKAKLSKYLNKGIFNKEDKRNAVKMIPFEGEGSGVELEYLLYYFDGTTDNSKLSINLTRKTATGYGGIDAVSSGFVEFINDTDIILHVPGLVKSHNPNLRVGVTQSVILEVKYDDNSNSFEELNVLDTVILYSSLMTSQSANKFDLSIGGKKYHIEIVG